jgi:guanylate kinase
MAKGNLFIISAPSGAGKTTILKRVISEIDRVGFSVSHTTREPRPGELHGKDYYFVKPVVFKAMQEQNEFLEYAEVHGNMYGTSKTVVDNLVKEGKDVILDIDVQGARQIMDLIGDKGVYIFISPPSLKELEERLSSRGTESDSVIATRLKNAEEEMKSLEIYDHVIVNDQVDQAIDELKTIITVERGRIGRNVS